MNSLPKKVYQDKLPETVKNTIILIIHQSK